MMIRHIKKLITMSLLLVFVTLANADLKQNSTVHINGGKSLPKTTTSAASDTSTAMSDEFSFDNSTVSDAKKSLRCWQDGVIIVAEKEWNLAVSQAPILVNNNKSQKAYAFDYTDTFCLYIGD